MNERPTTAVRAAAADSMTSSEFDAVTKRLFDALVHLHDAWDQYQFLYGESQERVRMLNACAGWFFALTQRLLLQDTILGISRLTDSQSMGKQENLVLSSLLSDPALQNRTEVKTDLKAAIDVAVAAAAPVRIHRHKYVAHLDHAIAVGTADEPLPGLTRARLTEVIGKLESAYNVHSQRIRDTHTFFDLGALSSGKALVAILEKSDRWKRYQELHPQSPSKNA